MYFLDKCSNFKAKDITPYTLNKNNPADYRKNAIYCIYNSRKNYMDCLNDFVELFNDDNTDIVDAALFCTFSYKIPELIPSYKNL